MAGIIVNSCVIHIMYLLYVVLFAGSFLILHEITIPLHELAHAIVAKICKYKPVVVLICSIWNKEKRKVKKLPGVNIYLMNKNDYETYFGKSGGIMIYDMKKYSLKERAITIAGPIISTFIFLAYGWISTYYLVLFVPQINVRLNINLSSTIIIILNIGSILFALGKKVWCFSKDSLDILSSEVDRISVRYVKNKNIKRISILPGVNDMTKILYHKEYAKVIEKIMTYPKLFYLYEQQINYLKS